MTKDNVIPFPDKKFLFSYEEIEEIEEIEEFLEDFELNFPEFIYANDNVPYDL
jgi:hypothetical protein